MEGHNFENLKAHILPLSHSQSFAIASTEWDLVSIEITDDFDHCPCGQDIKEHCYIRNRVTRAETYVGNVCINRFLHISTGSLFDGIKRLKADPTANANDAVIEYAHQRGYLYDDKEYNFLKCTRLKRKLTDKQAAWKEKINRRILEGIVVQKRRK